MFSVFFIVFGAVALGIVLAVFVTRQKTPGNEPMVPPEEEYGLDPKDRPPLTLEDLYRLGERLCQANGLTIKDRLVQNEGEVYWLTESQNEFFFGTYVLGFMQVDDERRFITMHDVLEFKDFIKSVGSSKGFLFTTGYFTADVHQPLEGPKVTLYNRRKVLADTPPA